MERKFEQHGERHRNTGTDAVGRGLPYLLELEPEIRAAALVDGDGVVLEYADGTDGDRPDFRSAAVELLGVVEGAGGRPFDSCHIASSEAEIFVVREGDLSLVAVTERFVLASLVSFDMRMTLRDLARGASVA